MRAEAKRLEVKVRRTGTAGALPVNLQQRKWLPTGRDGRSVPMADSGARPTTSRETARHRSNLAGANIDANNLGPSMFILGVADFTGATPPRI